MREWQYWTRNKLSILAGYLPAFNVASSKKSSERLYIDLMAGEPFNRDARTGEEFDGSARLALSSSPPFTRIALCEMEQKAAALEEDLRARYPGRHDFKVYPGDCNETIGRVLADLGRVAVGSDFRLCGPAGSRDPLGDAEEDRRLPEREDESRDMAADVALHGC